MMRHILHLVAALAMLLVVAGCEHPLGVVTPHIEAADLIVQDSAGTVLTRTEVNRRWMVDSLVVRENVPLRVVLTPIDFQGAPIDLTGRSDLSYRLEAEDGSLVQWEPQRGYGWIRPFGTGTTRIRFLIWHDTHADFVTPWLRLIIQSAATRATAPENS